MCGSVQLDCTRTHASNTFEHDLQVEIPRKENEGDPASANGVEGEGAVEHLFQGESRVELDAY